MKTLQIILIIVALLCFCFADNHLSAVFIGLGALACAGLIKEEHKLRKYRQRLENELYERGE